MRRFHLFLALLLVCVATSLFAQAQPPVAVAPKAAPDILPFKATETTLANGLKIIVVPTGFPNIVSVQIPVQTGSRNEVEPGKSGFAHFFEHLMFRGTPTYPPETYQQIMTRAGARENAGTGDDVTSYYCTFSKGDLETMLKVYADMFQNLAYSEADFKTESRAILGEYNKNNANPLAQLFEVQRDKAYSVHPYKHTTMGFLKDIEAMPTLYEYSKVFFNRWYRPQFTTLVVAGDVDPKAVVPMVEKYWGKWKGGSATPVPIPQEPASKGPIYAHVPWATPTVPWVSVGFRAPAFSDADKDYAAMDMIAALYFGSTSDLYKKLVVAEQKVDEFGANNPGNVDPGLFTVIARVKKTEDAVYVRDEVLKTIARARTVPVTARRLDEAKSANRYGVTRGLDSTERIAGLLSSFVAYKRSYTTINNLYRVYETLTPSDLQNAAQKYFTDAGLIVTTLSNEALPTQMAALPQLASLSPAAGHSAPPTTPIISPRSLAVPTGVAPIADRKLVLQKSVTPQLDIKLLFAVGSAHDPAGKEGLSALAASMIADAGSKALTTDQINAVLYPMAGSFVRQVDKEMTTFTGVIHRDNWRKFVSTVLPQLLEPGFRDEDFRRIKETQLNALTEDLRSNNEEELGKERLQANIFRGTPYGHPAVGTLEGIRAITIDDVKTFVRTAYTQANLTVGMSGNLPDELVDLLKQQLGRLPAGHARPRVAVAGARPSGIEVEIIEKDTRSTSISFGLPIAVTRAHPDFAALSVARVWLGEHRASNGRLYQRIREIRGMNYGDYAYIEVFPRGMFQFVPDPNLARQAQIFELWIRPVVPENGHLALRIAIHELDELLTKGLTQADFEEARDYLMKSVFVMTARQDEQLGYALDSLWYGTGEFTESMRKALAGMTLEQVNAAIRKHWSSKDLSVVIVTKDAAGLERRLVTDEFSPIQYDGQRPASLLEEDKVIGSRKLGIDLAHVRITPVAEVFAK
ncbi:MAG TPA: pitrilysin family protein [Vicinamibacterales bacterium]|jgi:zinc protease